MDYYFEEHLAVFYLMIPLDVKGKNDFAMVNMFNNARYFHTCEVSKSLVDGIQRSMLVMKRAYAKFCVIRHSRYVMKF